MQSNNRIQLAKIATMKTTKIPVALPSALEVQPVQLPPTLPKRAVKMLALLGRCRSSIRINTRGKSSQSSTSMPSLAKKVTNDKASKENLSLLIEYYPVLLDAPKREIYFLALIDILTHYGVKKQAAKAAKTVKYGSHVDGISTVEPEQYGRRFLEFMSKVIE